MKTTSLVLFMSVSICLHCDSAPTYGPSSQPACQVLPDVNIIQDSTCLHNDFQEDALLLFSDYDDTPFNCYIDTTSSTSEPLLSLLALTTSVDLLSLFPDVSLTSRTKYSDNLCRMKDTIIPFLNQTLRSICACPDEDCDMSSVSSNFSMADFQEALNSSTEYCLVDSIQRNLALLLDRIVLDKHVQSAEASRYRECQLTMDTRYQLGKIKNDIDELERLLHPSKASCPALSLPTSLAPECHVLLSAINQLVPRLAEEEHTSSLAIQLTMVLPKMASLLGKQNGVCPLSTNLPPMSDQCMVRYLKTYYFTAYDLLNEKLHLQNLRLEYNQCQAHDEVEMQ